MGRYPERDEGAGGCTWLTFQDGYPDSIVQETIGFLQEYHFVDDARYAANYLQVHGKRKSQAELKLYLQRKGISREIIREQLEETEHDSGEAIRVLLEKKHYRAGETAPEEMKEQEDALG